MLTLTRLSTRNIRRISRATPRKNISIHTNAVCTSSSSSHHQYHHNDSSSFGINQTSFLLAVGALPVIHFMRNDENLTTCSASKTPEKGQVKITDVEAELIARKLQGMIDIPGIPNIIEKPVVEQAIKAFIEVCPLVLPEGVFNRLIAGEAGANGVSEAIIRQISDAIYIPILSKEAQNAIVEQLCMILFTPSNFDAVRRKMLARAAREVFNADSRVLLATQLNKYVDIPLLSEDKEQVVAEMLVNTCFDLLEKFIPPPIRAMLENTSPKELQEVRRTMVVRLAERIDIPFASEEKEELALTYIVDFFLEFYGLQEGTKTPEEELVDLEHELKCLELELEAFEEISAEKIVKMKDRKNAMAQKQREIAKSIRKGPWFKFW